MSQKLAKKSNAFDFSTKENPQSDNKPTKSAFIDGEAQVKAKMKPKPREEGPPKIEDQKKKAAMASAKSEEEKNETELAEKDAESKQEMEMEFLMSSDRQLGAYETIHSVHSRRDNLLSSDNINQMNSGLNVFSSPPQELIMSNPMSETISPKSRNPGLFFQNQCQLESQDLNGLSSHSSQMQPSMSYHPYFLSKPIMDPLPHSKLYRESRTLEHTARKNSGQQDQGAQFATPFPSRLGQRTLSDNAPFFRNEGFGNFDFGKYTFGTPAKLGMAMHADHLKTQSMAREAVYEGGTLRLRNVKSIDKIPKSRQSDFTKADLKIYDDLFPQKIHLQASQERLFFPNNANFREFLRSSQDKDQSEARPGDARPPKSSRDKAIQHKRESPGNRFNLKNIRSQKPESELMSPENDHLSKFEEFPSELGLNGRFSATVRTPEPRKCGYSQQYNPISDMKVTKKGNISLDRNAGLKKNILKSRIEKKKKLLQKEDKMPNLLKEDPEIVKRIETLDKQLRNLGKRRKRKKNKKGLKGLSAFDERLISTLVKSYRRERLFSNSTSRYDFARRDIVIQKFEPNFDRDESKGEDNHPVLTIAHLINHFAAKVINT